MKEQQSNNRVELPGDTFIDIGVAGGASEEAFLGAVRTAFQEGHGVRIIGQGGQVQREFANQQQFDDWYSSEDGPAG